MKKDHPAQTVPPFAWILVCALLALAASFTACGAEGPPLSEPPPPAGPTARAGVGAGRAHLGTDPGAGTARVGRFGWKANFSTLRGFAAGAYRDEMGITNELFPLENAPNGAASLLPLVDISPDPEDFPDPVTGRSGVDNFTNFMRFLAPPPRGSITAAVQQGEAVFQQIGCASCHTPVLTTAVNVHPAFDRKPVPLFSD